jgi:hypothetical protein
MAKLKLRVQAELAKRQLLATVEASNRELVRGQAPAPDG